MYIVGQALTLGLALSFLLVPGNAVFLTVYGPQNLPYVYLAVAVLCTAALYLLIMLQAKMDLFPLSIGATLTVAALTFGFWALLASGEALWASAGALVIYAIQLEMGLVFIGAQAGRAFDLQKLKAVFSWIVAAFVSGFIVGGLGVAVFIGGGVASVHLLAVSAGLSLFQALLIMGTSRHVPELVQDPFGPREEPDAKPASLRQILADPLTSAVFAYQVLSAMVTQCAEYLFLDQAASRFQGEDEMARFLGQFSAVLNLVDLIVLVAFGGFLMTRYGLRYGLSANPILMTVLLVAAVGAVVVAGPAHLAFFVLIAAAQIANATAEDVAQRTSINATFKALLPGQRLSAQVTVELASTPIALGAAAAMIIAINAMPGTPPMNVAVATLALCLVWCCITWATYRRYQASIVAMARRRMLDGTAVDLSDVSSRNALLALLRSDDPRDVRIGLSLLDDDEEVEALVRAAAQGPSLEVQRAVVRRLQKKEPSLVRDVAGRLLASDAPGHAEDGLRLLGNLATGEDIETVKGYLSHQEPAIRATGAGVLLRAGPGLHGLAEQLDSAARSSDPGQRIFALRAITEAGLAPSVGVLVALLGDGDPEVRAQASAAIASLNDDQRLALLEHPMDHRTAVRFIRACRANASARFCAGVAARLGEDRDLAPDMVRLLGAAGWRATPEARATLDALIEREAARIATARNWLDAISTGDPAILPSVRRLRRALAQEAATAGRQLCDLLGLIHDRQLMARVARVMQGASREDAGISLESLDLLLAQPHRGMVISALQAAFGSSPEEVPGNGRSRTYVLTLARDLARDCRWAIRPDWLLASALAVVEAAGGSGPHLRGLGALGPVSAELLRRDEVTAQGFPDQR